MEDMKGVYSEKTIDHFLKPRNLGEIPAPDGFGRVTGPCGDTMEIYLKLRDGRVTNASFWTDGANTLKEAIKDYLAFKNEPWKRAYRS